MMSPHNGILAGDFVYDASVCGLRVKNSNKSGRLLPFSEVRGLGSKV